MLLFTELYFHHQSHPQLGFVFTLALVSSFFLELFLHSSPVVFGHLLIRGVHLSVSYLFAFSYCSWGSQSRILKWFSIPFSSGPHFVRILHKDLSVLGGLTWHVLVSLSQQGYSVCDQIGQCYVIVVSVCLTSDAFPLCLPSYWVFSYLGCRVSLHSCSNKVQALILTLDVGYLLMATGTDLGRRVSPLACHSSATHPPKI